MESVACSADTLIERAQTVIFDASSIFPLDIVPDRLIIDLSKIVIMYREPLGQETEHTILLSEVRDVDIEVNYFIGTLRILVSGPGVMWTSITNLHKRDAVTAKHLIEGLLISKAEQYDLSMLSISDLIARLALVGNWNHGQKKQGTLSR